MIVNGRVMPRPRVEIAVVESSHRPVVGRAVPEAAQGQLLVGVRASSRLVALGPVSVVSDMPVHRATRHRHGSTGFPAVVGDGRMAGVRRSGGPHGIHGTRERGTPASG